MFCDLIQHFAQLSFVNCFWREAINVPEKEKTKKVLLICATNKTFPGVISRVGKKDRRSCLPSQQRKQSRFRI